MYSNYGDKAAEDAVLLVDGEAVLALNGEGRVDLGARRRLWADVLADTHPDDRDRLAAAIEVAKQGRVAPGPVQWRRSNLDPARFFAEARAVAHERGALLLVSHTNGPLAVPGALRNAMSSRQRVAAVIDEDTRIRLVSDAVRQLGLRPEAMIGRLASTAVPAVPYWAPGDARVADADSWRRSFRQLARENGRIELGRFEIVDGHGRTRIAAVSASWLGSGVLPPHEAGGAWSDGYLIVGEDVTAEASAAELAHTQERRFRALLESSHDVLCLVDSQLRVRYVSPAGSSMFGVPVEEIVGTDINEWVEDGLSQAGASSGRWWTQNVTLRSRDGAGRSVEMVVSDRVGDPAVQGLVLNLRDVTDRVAAEEAMRDLELRSTTAIEALSEGLVVLDADARITHANAAATVILETDRNEMVGRHTYDIGWRFVTREGSHVDELAAPYSLTRRTGVAVDPIVLGMGDDGDTRWIRMSSRPLPRDDGRFDVVITLADVTAQVAAEEQLRATSLWYQALVSNAHESASVRDYEGNIFYVSPAAEDLLGWPLEHYGPPGSVQIHEDDMSAVWLASTEARNNPGRSVPVTYRAMHRNGTWRWINSHILDATADPVIQGVVTNSRDVTEQVEAEMALRASEDRFRSAFSSSPLGMALIDADGVIEEANQTLPAVAAPGWEGRTLEGAALSDVLGVNLGSLTNWVARTREIGAIEVGTADGRWLSVTANAAYGADAAFRHTIVHVADVTGVREARDEVVELNHQLSAVLASLATEREAERRRIAVGLHDNAVQSLVAARWTGDRVASETDPAHRRRIGEQMSAALASAIDSLRTLIFDLRPPLLDEGGLSLAVSQLVEHVQHHLPVELDDQLDGVRVHPDVENLVFRTLQEALRNVVQHAGAQRVMVCLRAQGGRIAGMITDDGHGIERSDLDAKANSGHIGVVSMRETLQAVGGTFAITNVPSGGCRVRFTVPTSPHASDEDQLR